MSFVARGSAAFITAGLWIMRAAGYASIGWLVTFPAYWFGAADTWFLPVHFAVGVLGFGCAVVALVLIGAGLLGDRLASLARPEPGSRPPDRL